MPLTPLISSFRNPCKWHELSPLQALKGDAGLRLLEAACSSDEISMQQLLETKPALLQQVTALITGDANTATTDSALNFLFTVSTTACGRQHLSKCLQSEGGGQMLAFMEQLFALQVSSQVCMARVLARFV